MVDQSKVKAVQIALWIQTSVPFLFLLARLYTKRRLRNPFGLDDWLLGLSWVRHIPFHHFIAFAKVL